MITVEVYTDSVASANLTGALAAALAPILVNVVDSPNTAFRDAVHFVRESTKSVGGKKKRRKKLKEGIGENEIKQNGNGQKYWWEIMSARDVLENNNKNKGTRDVELER